ncbi:macrophage mannose receptor 1-like [Sphaeramia orbicularis]|uniref:macrophage mannose receptor 1-like n=1 Tax=Sphaeramia orbicularis TaxID=375764 RepID=UPI0011812CBD|nr:macrophage mannose receptor 1-like [Sphaeramia orbicularis]
MRVTLTVFVLLIQTMHCLASDDSEFQLSNKATGFCLVAPYGDCTDEPLCWTTNGRLLSWYKKKCLGAQGANVGSSITEYDCDENSPLQQWECKNETVLALKGHELYIELTADNAAVLSSTIGPNTHLTIPGTSIGPCTKKPRELYTIGGNSFGRPCMFPFFYNNRWYADCTTEGSSTGRPWCAVETKFDHALWGNCPTTAKEDWIKHPTTGALYQLNTESALTWTQADVSCKQQGASLLSISDPHEYAYITAHLGSGSQRSGQGERLWIGLVLDPEHGWQWSNGRPYSYLKWDSGHPVSTPGHSCAIINDAVQDSWQSSLCNKKLGYICYSKGVTEPPTAAPEAGHCSSPWIPYSGHCFYLNRIKKTWTDAQRECRKEGGDLASIRNVEDQSFMISQLGYESTDELWIGLNDRRTEGLFEWSDHSVVHFTSWTYGELYDSANAEDCVLIKGENGNWADRRCEERHGFICMKSSASEPSEDEVEQNIGCKTGWRRHGSYCYFVGTETKTFDDAKEDCKASGSYLADVSNGVDNAFLVSLVGARPEKYFWLGLSNQKHIDIFVWMNTDTVRYTHWNTGMPGHRQGCVAMMSGLHAGLWDVLPCTNRTKYICKHLAEGAVATPAPTVVPLPACAQGWKRVGSRQHCYKMFEGESYTKRTWYEARDFCRTIGGDLLSIHSSNEIRAEYTYGSFWIGLSAPDPVTGFVWSDGSPVNFQHWQSGEPNNKNNVESCVEFFVHQADWSGSWNDVQCEKQIGWMCQIQAGVTPKPPPGNVVKFNTTSDGWIEWNENQYLINQELMVNEEARHFCQQRHGDLVSIESEAENIFLWQQIQSSSTSFWLGATVDVDASFEWMDGSQALFQRWDEGQPALKNFDENCGVMTTSMGFWHAFSCGLEFGSICKRRGLVHANTTAAPTVPPEGGCPSPWKKFKSKCYNIIDNEASTWDQARKQCKWMNGKLVSIPSRHVEVFLINQIMAKPTTNFWTGLNSFEGGTYYWTDGSKRSYINPDLMRKIKEIPFELRWMHTFRTMGTWGPFDIQNKCVALSNSPNGSGIWKVTSCNDTNGFICHRNVDPSLKDIPDPTSPTDYIKIFNDSVKVVTQKMNWDAAKKHCLLDGAKLASLRNVWTQAYADLQAMNLKAPLWIGLNKDENNGYFQYTDGWHLNDAKWDVGEPSRDRPCVFVDVNGQWKTAHCNETMNSLCLKSTDEPPPEIKDFPGVCPDNQQGGDIYWQPFKGYCYKFFTEETDWIHASASCIRHDAKLLSIEDPSEQDFIFNSIKMLDDSAHTVWIGLIRSKKGAWLWSDGTVMDYTNWGEGQPSEYNNAVIVLSDGKWRSAFHWFNKPYICKTRKVLIPKPSPSTTHENPVLRRSHIALAAVIVITGIVMGIFIALFIFKKSGHRLPIPEKLTTFDNPLFSSNKQSEPNVADTSKLVDNAEEDNHQPIMTI